MKAKAIILAVGLEVRIGLIDVDGHNYPNLPLKNIREEQK